MFGEASLQTLFARAIEIDDEAQRDAFLVEACGDDAALRRTVEQLVAAHAKVGRFMATPAPEAALSAMALLPALGEQPGMMIGPYKLLEQIGEGGMGLVFMAEQCLPLRRRVALKIIKPGLDTRAVITRFEAERQALAIMDHPFIARVFDAGATDSGRPYFVMELVRGQPITDYCQQRGLPLRERLTLFLDVCQAVQHAHLKGVIHRDLKPTNILVGQSDTAPVPKVIDFGVAKATTSQMLTDKTLFTQFSQIIGTPLYMSPEQADPDNQDVDTRSDVYSLGVVLYELLTGSTPFDVERLRSVSHGEMRRIIREEEPPKPSTRATMAAMSTESSNLQLSRTIDVSALQGDLDWITLKALEKDRRRRYESAAALSADIRRYLDDEPIQAAAPSTFYRLRKLVRRRRAETVVGLTLLTACLIGFITLVTSRMAISEALDSSQRAELQASADRDRYRSERDRAEGNLYVADVRLAHEEWTQGNVAAAERLLTAHIPRPSDTDRRRWEWHYLNGLRHSALATIGDQTTGMNIVEWSSDGERLAVADADFAIRILDASTHHETALLRGHAASLQALDWSPTAPRLASSDLDGVVRVWDVHSGSSTVLTEAKAIVMCVAWSRNGARLAMCDSTGKIIVWDGADGRELARMSEPQWAWSVAWSPDGSRLASSGNDTGIRIWDAVSGQLLTCREHAHTQAITSLCWSPDGRQIASGSRDNVVKIWDIDSWVPYELHGHRGIITSVDWRPDGAELASSAGDGRVIIWNVKDRTARSVLRGHQRSVCNVCWNTEGTRLATSSWDGTVKIWDPTREAAFARFASNSFAAWSPDGRRLVALVRTTAEAPAALQIVDYLGQPQGAPFPVTTGHGETITGLHPRVAWSPNGHWIAVAFSTERQLRVHVIDSKTGAAILTQCIPKVHEASPSGIRSVAFSPDSTRVAVALLNESPHEIAVWEIATGQRIASLLSTGFTWADSLAFSPDGRRLAATYFDSQLKIWNTTTWREAMSLDRMPANDRSSAGGGHMVTWSPDGSTFATGNIDGEVILVDATTGREVRRWAAHASQLFAIAFSPDGDRLVTGGEDRCVKVWNPATGDNLLTLRAHEHGVRDVAWSSDGRHLLSSDENVNLIWTALDATPHAGR